MAKTTKKARGKAFKPGNKKSNGRKPGAKNRITLLREAREAEAKTYKKISEILELPIAKIKATAKSIKEGNDPKIAKMSAWEAALWRRVSAAVSSPSGYLFSEILSKKFRYHEIQSELAEREARKVGESLSDYALRLMLDTPGRRAGVGASTLARLAIEQENGLRQNENNLRHHEIEKERLKYIRQNTVTFDQLNELSLVYENAIKTVLAGDAERFKRYVELASQGIQKWRDKAMVAEADENGAR